MTEDSSINPVRVTGEERSRPAFRLLARAAIELARLSLTRHKELPTESAARSSKDETSDE
jgi:hypothetical protein